MIRIRITIETIIAIIVLVIAAIAITNGIPIAIFFFSKLDL